MILNLNRAGEDLLGYPAVDNGDHELLIYDLFIDSDDRLHYDKLLEKDGKIDNLEVLIYGKDRRILTIRLSVVARRVDLGEIEGYEGFMLDVSDQKKIEKELRQSEEKYRTVVENSLAAIYMFQDEGILSYVNQRLLELSGYDNPHELIGQPFWIFVHPEDREFVRQTGLKREQVETNPRHYSLRLCKKDGSVIWVELFGTHATYLGKPAVIGNFIDITQVKKAEEEIRHLSRRLIGAIEDERKNLASDLHDEFGQLLTTLQFDIELLEQSIPIKFYDSRNRCGKIMDRIQLLAESIRTTTSRLRPELLDQMGLVPAMRFHINEIIDCRPGIDIKLRVNVLEKRFDSTIELTLFRIFQEALNNIIKHAGASCVDIALTSQPSKVQLSIRDDGIGFDPYSNNEPRSTVNQGLGLPIMKERVASLGGTVVVNSSKNLGTDVLVELPLKGISEL